MKQDRWFALCGIASVVVELVGTIVASGKGTTHSLTWTSKTSTIVHAFATPSGTAVWVGGYLEILSMGLFLAFAVWACARLGGGILASLGRGFAIASTAVNMVSLGLLGAEAYLAGHGLSVSVARAVVTVNGAIFVTTWFLSAFFLLALAPLALAAGRRIVGWSAVGVAVYTLAATAVSAANAGQFSALLFLLWVVGASIALGRSPQRAPAAAVAGI